MFVRKGIWLQREGLLALQGRIIDELRLKVDCLTQDVKDHEEAFRQLVVEAECGPCPIGSAKRERA
jgi:hypothetical protein